MRLGKATAAAAVLALALVTPATAHEESALHALTVIDSVSPNVEGIEVRMVHLDAPALVVRNDTDEVLTVLGEKGEPFLQISRDGVRANSESPTTYVSSAPRREVVPPDVKASADPKWVVFSEDASWTWFDPRLRFSSKRTSWEVPLMLGGQPIMVSGGFETLQGHGHFVTEMTPPTVDGLTMRLTQGLIPAVYVRNDTGETLTVPGDAGEPFLRIGPKGVTANLRSPTYYTSGSTAILKVPAMADAAAPPRWEKVSPYPVWAWLERRAAVPAELYQRDQLGTEERAVLEWTSEYTLGGEPLPVTGHVNWIPPRAAAGGEHDSDTPWLLIAVVAGAGCLAALSLVVRRPRAAT